MTTDPAPTTTPEASVSPKSGRGNVWHNVVVRLADEGVPLQALVRALMMPYDDIREILDDAVGRGLLLSIPRQDWPPGTRRDERQPSTVPLEYEDEHMTMLVMRAFNLTPAEARMLLAMLRRPEVTKGTLHAAAQREGAAPADETEIKIVDVYICKMRKKLPAEIKIVTIWGKGYFITPEGKAAAFRLLGIKQDEFSAGASGGVTVVEQREAA